MDNILVTDAMPKKLGKVLKINRPAYWAFQWFNLSMELKHNIDQQYIKWNALEH